MPDRIIRRLNGARGSALLSIGFAGAAHGVAYLPVQGLPDSIPTGLLAVGSFIPLSVWGVLWVAVGVVATIASTLDRHGFPREWDCWGFYLFTGGSLVWSFGYYVGFFTALLPGGDPPNRQWINGAVYLGIAGLAMSTMRMRNRFIIDLRDFRIDLRDSS